MCCELYFHIHTVSRHHTFAVVAVIVPLPLLPARGSGAFTDFATQNVEGQMYKALKNLKRETALQTARPPC
jgi:hypothetical protein